MPQTTSALSFKDCKVEISTDNAAWSNISGFATEVMLGGGDRQFGEEFTLDGETPIVLPGKRGSYDVTIKSVYTEGASDPFEVLRPRYEQALPIYVRWSPKGGSTGNFLYTTAIGYLMSPVYPTGSASDGKPVMFEFKVKTNTITKSVVA